MTRNAIDIHNVSRNFGDVRAVSGLSLTVQNGEVFGFLGHNGAGKTTTVRLLNGVLKADAGEMRVLGLDPLTEGPALRARTGVLTETPSLDERLTAVENLTIYADLYGVPQDQVRQRVETSLGQFGLSERAGDKVGGYSKGMKQRLALARAFLHEPELIFLDEPTSGLDPIATQEVHDMIRHVSREQGHTVFLCTHNLVEAQRLCNRVAVMEKGHMVAVGTAQELAHEIGAEMRYMLEVDKADAAAQLLKVNGRVKAVQPEDSGLSITVNERESIPDVLETLVQGSVRVYALTPQQTSLEDIYMALHRREEK